jgi:hypothetical protein
MASIIMSRRLSLPAARHCALLAGAAKRVTTGGVTQQRRRGLADMPTPPPGYRAKLACLDLEGVLIPEVWVNLAERVGVEELKRTTRDEPVYEKLMRQRLDIMKREGLTIHDINAAIESMEPFPGAPEFVEVSSSEPFPSLRSSESACARASERWLSTHGRLLCKPPAFARHAHRRSVRPAPPSLPASCSPSTPYTRFAVAARAVSGDHPI